MPVHSEHRPKSIVYTIYLYECLFNGDQRLYPAEQRSTS